MTDHGSSLLFSREELLCLLNDSTFFLLFELSTCFRHPDSHHRPSFEEIVRRLSDNNILVVKLGDLSEYSVIGAPLRTSEGQYRDLQMTYRQTR